MRITWRKLCLIYTAIAAIKASLDASTSFSIIPICLVRSFVEFHATANRVLSVELQIKFSGIRIASHLAHIWLSIIVLSQAVSVGVDRDVLR